MAVHLNEAQTLVSDWDTKKKALDKAVLEERTARDLLFATVFPNPVEGSGNKFDIGFNKILQATYRINRKISDMALFESKRAAGEIPTDIVDALVRFKPELSETGWKNAPSSARLFFADVVEEKPGAPSFKLVSKKAP